MKRLIVIAVTVAGLLVVATTGFAAFGDTPNGYGSAGCGLGSMAFGNEPGPVQIIAATTNNIVFPQTFAISTGTSNCTKSTKFAGAERLNEFVVANMDNLAKDIAMGHGESLDTLAELIGISTDQRASIYARLQANFSSIFTSEKVESAEVVDNIISVIKG